jgi:hypothetical protein
LPRGGTQQLTCEQSHDSLLNGGRDSSYIDKR